MTQRKSNAKRRIVFVDPDDPDAPFWWPAMVVPESEIEVFRRTMTTDVKQPGPNEHLVCYFEDGSFSVVHERELVPFSPDEPPYTDYLRGEDAFIFKKDRAVQLATLYWETGIVPHSFTWVRDTERQVSQATDVLNHCRDTKSSRKKSKKSKSTSHGSNQLRTSKTVGTKQQSQPPPQQQQQSNTSTTTTTTTSNTSTTTANTKSHTSSQCTHCSEMVTMEKSVVLCQHCHDQWNKSKEMTTMTTTTALQERSMAMTVYTSHRYHPYSVSCVKDVRLWGSNGMVLDKLRSILPLHRRQRWHQLMMMQTSSSTHDVAAPMDITCMTTT